MSKTSIQMIDIDAIASKSRQSVLGRGKEIEASCAGRVTTLGLP